MELSNLKYPQQTIDACIPIDDELKLTLGHLIIFSKLGISLDKIDETNILETIALLKVHDWPTLQKCQTSSKVKLKDLPRYLARTIDLVTRSYDCFIPGKQDSDTTSCSVVKGCGFPLETAVMLMKELHMTFEQAMETDLSRAFAFTACLRQFNGGENGGPDYYERAYIDKLKQKISTKDS